MVKVLCLCGYTQSAAIFRGRLSAIRKATSSKTSWTFVDPPHIVQAVNLPGGSLVQYDSTADSSTSEEEIPRAWFFAKDYTDENGQPKKRYEGMDETWSLLKDVLEKETYDVVLGFSQGAAIAGALASKLTLPNPTINHPPFKVAILVSGFAMEDANSDMFPPNNAKSPANTLQIIGRGDVIVSLERAETLVAKFENPRVEYHDGGHYVPSKANYRQFFKNIFNALDASPDTEAWRDVPPPGNINSGTSTPTSSTPGKL